MLVFAFLAISLRSSVKKVLSLIGVFFCAAILTIMLNAEFIATLLVLVYMGAIAMLFLFVVMMIGESDVIKITEKKRNLLPAILTSMTFSGLICIILLSNIGKPGDLNVQFTISDIGQTIYGQFGEIFIYVGFILLTALIGAILLTIHYKSQRISQKVKFDSKVDLKYPEIRSGVKI